jgi:hypothetical protein
LGFEDILFDVTIGRELRHLIKIDMPHPYSPSVCPSSPPPEYKSQQAWGYQCSHLCLQVKSFRYGRPECLSCFTGYIEGLLGCELEIPEKTALIMQKIFNL